MNFADSIAAQAAEHLAANIERIRKQAARRARDNGFDEACAADAAEHMYATGADHETIVTTVAGPYQPRKVA